MIKAMLLCLILFACTGAGRALSAGRKRRAEALNELLAALRVLRLRMLNSLEPAGVLLRKSEAGLLRDLGNRLWEGETLAESWLALRSEEQQRGRRLDSLTDGDLNLLDDFFRELGGSGREELSTRFSIAIAGLEEAYDGARKRFADVSKTYTALGALVGVGVCIMIV